MQTANIKITISDESGEVLEQITMSLPRLSSLGRRDSDILGAPTFDADGAQAHIIDVIADAASTVHARLDIERKRSAGEPVAEAPLLRINNPAARYNLRRPKEGSVFVSIRKRDGRPMWAIDYETESGEECTQFFSLSETLGMSHWFGSWQIRNVLTSSSLDFPRDAGAPLSADDAHRMLDAALAWS